LNRDDCGSRPGLQEVSDTDSLKKKKKKKKKQGGRAVNTRGLELEVDGIVLKRAAKLLIVKHLGELAVELGNELNR